MEIQVATERAFVITAGFTFAQFKERAWDKKVQAFSSGLGGFLSRPKPEEVEIVYSELRYEPFWHISASARYVYARARSYRVAVAAPEVEHVHVGETDYPVAAGRDAKEPRGFTVSGVEHCRETLRAEQLLDAVTGQPGEFAPYLKVPASEIPDLAAFKPADSLVVVPTVRAGTVVHGIVGGLFKSVQADQVSEQVISVDAMDLYFRPTFAAEYFWKVKDKRTVVEFDGSNGEIRTHSGHTIREQIQGVLSQDLLFDVTADAVGMFLPGGSIAVKLARAGARRVMGGEN